MSVHHLEKQSKPLYIQLANYLTENIERGHFEQNSLLPSEKKLMADFNVSRATVRKAIQTLNEQNITYTQKGKGTYVSQKKLRHNFSEVIGLTEESLTNGYNVSNEILDFSVSQSSFSVAQKLNIKEGEFVYFCIRRRYLDNQIVAMEKFYIPVQYLPNMQKEDLQNSKYQHFEKQGLVIDRVKQKISPIIPTEDIRELLSIKSNIPILSNESRTFLDDGRVLEIAKVYFNPDAYDFELTAYNN